MRYTILALAGLTILSTGCGKKPPPPVATPQAEESAATMPDRSGDADAARAAEEARRREAAERSRREALLMETVYFDYDRAEVRTDSRQKLDTKVPVLRENPAYRLRIEGHADERGSTEYNLALGMRRAMSVRDYLAGFGVDVSRLEVVSMGEERPAATGSNEASWALNRRSEFHILSAPTPVTEAADAETADVDGSASAGGTGASDER